MPLDDTTKHYALAQEDTTADPFTLPALIAWLRTQEPATEYDFMSTDDCLLCRYIRARGFHSATLGGYGKVYLGNTKIGQFQFEANGQGPAVGTPRNVGAALARAEALAKSEGGPVLVQPFIRSEVGWW